MYGPFRPTIWPGTGDAIGPKNGVFCETAMALVYPNKAAMKINWNKKIICSSFSVGTDGDEDFPKVFGDFLETYAMR